MKSQWWNSKKGAGEPNRHCEKSPGELGSTPLLGSEGAQKGSEGPHAVDGGFQERLGSGSN